MSRLKPPSWTEPGHTAVTVSFWLSWRKCKYTEDKATAVSSILTQSLSVHQLLSFFCFLRFPFSVLSLSSSLTVLVFLGGSEWKASRVQGTSQSSHRAEADTQHDMTASILQKTEECGITCASKSTWRNTKLLALSVTVGQPLSLTEKNLFFFQTFVDVNCNNKSYNQ